MSTEENILDNYQLMKTHGVKFGKCYLNWIRKIKRQVDKKYCIK
jgi:hypothetical protein